VETVDRTYVLQHRKRPVYDLGLWLFQRVVWKRSMEDDAANNVGGWGKGTMRVPGWVVWRFRIHSRECQKRREERNGEQEESDGGGGFVGGLFGSGGGSSISKTRRNSSLIYRRLPTTMNS